MSYDLYFYKHKQTNLSQEDIANYLSANLVAPGEGGHQWFFANQDTEAYYSFDLNPPETAPETPEEDFPDFDNTGLSFNLNYLRPDFFGLEAFRFVNKMVADLGLYVLNTQIGAVSDKPYRPGEQDLYENWSTTNQRFFRDHYQEMVADYYPKEAANSVWRYNFQRNAWQRKLGNDHFVPRIFFFRKKDDRQVITVAAWVEHSPGILPVADYYYIVKRYRKLLRKVEEEGLVAYSTVMEACGSYFEDVAVEGVEGCRMLHPGKALQLKDIFNNLQIAHAMEPFAERISMDKLWHYKPGE